MLYEDGPDVPLPANMIQDIVVTSAMTAYDNASNPNRTRGGVKKCDDMYATSQLLFPIYAVPSKPNNVLLFTVSIHFQEQWMALC